ncbi:MAG: hypothetical protein A3E83_03885 [Gammaproteobacteria bacterium RIFCSPHIGHO2_12_FULL_41_20]|nr:MAG: hypothetical protein A3E83_03885 [Gammaproteobacteria bacterium RIFCSPHIGHO2_12_FULL_41_20]
MRKIIWTCILASILCSSCAQIATSGAQALYNHNDVKKSLDDNLATLHANQALYVKSNQFKNTDINIATYHSEMLLTGQVPTPWQKNQAESIVKTISNVSHVYNFITVSPPLPPLKQVSDAWLTTKIKAKLIASNDVDGRQIKVVTEDGTVYLMGILQQDQAEAAVDIASNTDGVQKVIKMFSYIHISKATDGFSENS